MPTVIRLEQVCVSKRERLVLGDVTLRFEPGGAYAILGPSGAGKTTLLRLLNRLEEPTSGTLWFHDVPYTQLSPVTLRQRVAMVFQIPAVFAGSVRDNLLVPLRLHDHGGKPTDDLVRLLDLAGLEASFLDRDATALSVGEKQRVCIARALVSEPEVLLLDEPTAALDPTAAQRLLVSIIDLNRRLGLTVIIVNHRPEQARLVGGEVILVAGGRVAERTSTEQFFAQPSSDAGRTYLEGARSGAST